MIPGRDKRGQNYYQNRSATLLTLMDIWKFGSRDACQPTTSSALTPTIPMTAKLSVSVLCMVATLTSFCWGQAPQAAEPSDEAARLVLDLGSELFEEREKASAELLRLGESALPALEQGFKSPDAEIRFRCNQLVTDIREANRQKTEEKRFREFVQSGLRAGGKAAPNWERLQELVERDPETKTLLIELHEYDSAFLKLAVEQPERVPKWCSDRRFQLMDEIVLLRQSGQDPALINTKVRMYVKQSLALPGVDLYMLGQVYQFGKPSELDKDPAFMKLYRLRLADQFARLSERGPIDVNVVRDLSELAGSFGMQQEFKEAIRPVAAAAVARILGGPFDKKAQSEAYGLLRLARSYEVEGIAPVALKAGLSKDFDVKARAQAVDLVGRYGTKDQIEPLNQLLGDGTEISKFGQITIDGVGYSSNLGDAALAAMVRLSGENLADYGLGDGPAAGYFGPSEEEIEAIRQNAILKWKAR